MRGRVKLVGHISNPTTQEARALCVERDGRFAFNFLPSWAYLGSVTCILCTDSQVINNSWSQKEMERASAPQWSMEFTAFLHGWMFLLFTFTLTLASSSSCYQRQRLFLKFLRLM